MSSGLSQSLWKKAGCSSHVKGCCGQLGQSPPELITLAPALLTQANQEGVAGQSQLSAFTPPSSQTRAAL